MKDYFNRIQYKKNLLRLNCIVNVVITDATRSNVNTSGLNIESSYCDTENESYHQEDCKKFNEFKNNSIHKGMKDISPYKKGLDVLMDAYLLGKCDIFTNLEEMLVLFQRELIQN